MNGNYVDTPIGRLWVAEENNILTGVFFDSCGGFAETGIVRVTETPLLNESARQLTAYFCGDLKKFELPLKEASTEFYKKVRAALVADVPYGETVTYGELAILAGNPLAFRAAATAMRKNPFPIILPCHRVVHKNGANCRYLGGIEVKNYLLDLEKKYR